MSNNGKRSLYNADAAYNTWAHVAIVYKGPSNDGGIVAYKDGEYKGHDKWSRDTHENGSPGVGEIMIGRLFKGTGNSRYAKASVDELLIWNKELGADQIKKISETV